MSDIVTRLRQTRADMIGTDDEAHYWDCQDAASEIERLRLTEAERAAVEWFACYGVDRPLGHSTTLRGLLERLG